MLDPRGSRRLAVGILVPVALVTLAAVLLWIVDSRFVLTGPYDGRSPRAFDREVWLAAAEDPDGARFLMVTDLLERELLEGLSLEQAGELLGPPTGTAHFADLGPCWYLGPEPGPMSIDSAWLLLELRGGRVVTD